MNDYNKYPPKTYDADVCLTIGEVAYSFLHLPAWASGTALWQTKFAGAMKTALTEVALAMPLDTFPWWDSVNADYKAEVAPVLNIFGQRYHDHFITSYPIDATDAEKADAVLGALKLLCGVLNNTYVRYIPMLTAFKAKETDLLAKIAVTSSAVARFNDTPQDGGMYDDDDHTTNITQSNATSESDNVTPVMRLDEIRRMWRNIQKEWVDEIGRVTIEGGNL